MVYDGYIELPVFYYITGICACTVFFRFFSKREHKIWTQKIIWNPTDIFFRLNEGGCIIDLPFIPALFLVVLLVIVVLFAIYTNNCPNNSGWNGKIQFKDKLNHQKQNHVKQLKLQKIC